MPAYPRCGALLRNGQPCGRAVADGSEFCPHHTELLEVVGAEKLRRGQIPKKRTLKEPVLRVVLERTEPELTSATITDADPASVRPSLALAAAENLDALKDSPLQAAASATKPAWITVECSGCGERSRVEAPVPDVRARVAAIELLLREGLGRPATAEETRPVRLPATVSAVKDMPWMTCKRCSPSRTSKRSPPHSATVAGRSFATSSRPSPTRSGTPFARRSSS
jgi:hypothetical protein